MEFIAKLERTVLGWFKGVPSLPAGARKWLGDNVWWIVLIGAILTILGILGALVAIGAAISLLGTVAVSYYVSPAVTSWAVISGIIALAFSVVQGILLLMAIQPLKEKQKKGWVLLFATWLVGGVGVVVNAILSLSIIGFILGVLFGAVWMAISGYFLVEIHGQFAHVERSRGVRKAK
jgi:FtsH-binding integral membrane protein